MHCTDCSNPIRHCTCNVFGGNGNAAPLLPKEPRMVEEAHGHGDKGMAFYRYEDKALDVLLDVRRKDSRSGFVETWRYRWLPDCTFPNYTALRQAVNLLTPETVAAERAKWPKLVKEPHLRTGSTTHCWLHADAPATHMGWVQTSWHEYDGLTAIICTACAEAAKTDPGVIVRASEKRRADCAARKPLLQSLLEATSDSLSQGDGRG